VGFVFYEDIKWKSICIQNYTQFAFIFTNISVMKLTYILFLICASAEILLAQTLYPNPELKPFYHGVASGDPLTDGVIIWTRITPESDQNEDIYVAWQVAEDIQFRDIVVEGEVQTNASRDYTIKVDVAGLSPDQYYYYRFKAPNGGISPTGRTKTAPTALRENIRFAGVSCSSIYSGYFNAYRRIAERNDIDAVIHVGDYIYDFVDEQEQIRVPDNAVLDIIQGPDTKDKWRALHAYYKLDPDLRAVHQQHPWIIIWDNHDLQGAVGNGFDPEAIASMEAFLEWTPVRVPNPNVVNKIYRTLKYGDLLDIVVMDIDLFRDPQAEAFGDIIDNPDRSILGEEQFNWLKSELLNSTAKWRLLCSSKPMGQWHLFGLPNILPFDFPSINDYGFPFSSGTWDGYPYERQLLYEFMRENNINNNIALSGDMHTYFFHDMVENPWNPLLYNPNTGGSSVGAEFVPGSVSRGNLDETLAGLGFATTSPAFADFVEGLIRFLNPHNVYMDFVNHGYGILDFRPEKVTGEFWFSPILNPSDTEQFDASFTCFEGMNRWDRNRNPLPIESLYLGPEQPSFERIDLSDYEAIVSNNESASVLKGYSFSELSPNPTQSSSEFIFSTNENRRIEISIYNLTTGQHITTLFDGVMGANHPFIGKINQEMLPNSGTYAILIRGNDFVDMKPLVFIKQ
jgi:alkaline phosphatase D